MGAKCVAHELPQISIQYKRCEWKSVKLRLRDTRFGIMSRTILYMYRAEANFFRKY